MSDENLSITYKVNINERLEELKKTTTFVQEKSIAFHTEHVNAMDKFEVYVKKEITELRTKFESYTTTNHTQAIREDQQKQITELQAKVSNPEWLDVVILKLMEPMKEVLQDFLIHEKSTYSLTPPSYQEIMNNVDKMLQRLSCEKTESISDHGLIGISPTSDIENDSKPEKEKDCRFHEKGLCEINMANNCHNKDCKGTPKLVREEDLKFLFGEAHATYDINYTKINELEKRYKLE